MMKPAVRVHLSIVSPNVTHNEDLTKPLALFD